MKRVFLIVLWGGLSLPVLHAQASPLLDLAGSGTVTQIQQAVTSGADVNARDAADRTVLMLAAASNPDPAVISILLKAGAKINARGPNGWTALMMAAYDNPNPEVVETLLKAGADGKARSGAGETAYDYSRDNEKVRGGPAYSDLRKAQR
ncbi:MAG: ankyrin repeat domain-containing protein [Spirochaetia bacterium]